MIPLPFAAMHVFLRVDESYEASPDDVGTERQGLGTGQEQRRESSRPIGASQTTACPSTQYMR
jgi:hypothetical protein